MKKSIEASEWIGQGSGRLYNRSGLPVNHPESWPSLWVKKYGSLDGFPAEEIDLSGFKNSDGNYYYKCDHCKCANWVGNKEIFWVKHHANYSK